MTLGAMMVDVCQGNPGAISVLVQLQDRYHDRLISLVKTLYENNIRGIELCLMYKQCNKDIDFFVSFVTTR